MEGSLYTAGASPGSRYQGAAAFPFSPANALGTRGHQYHGKNYKHGPRATGPGVQRRERARRHGSKINANTFIPPTASKKFRTQQCRRRLWMLEAKAKDATIEQASQLSKVIAQQKNRLERLSQRRRGKGRKHGNNKPEKLLEDESKRLVAWHKHVYDDQQTTRAAGLAWIKGCLDDGKWKGKWGSLPKPSQEAFIDLMLHFMAPKPGGPTALPRDNMCAEAKYFLEQYDELPLRPNSKELAKARIRMVREMRLTGWYNTEVQKGLEVTRHEVSQAMLGLRLNTFEGVVTHGYQKLELPEDAHFYKAKVIEWKGRETWVGVRDHELPLRLGRNESNPPPPLTAINLQLHNLRESPDMEDQDMDSGSDEDESDGQDSGSGEGESHGQDSGSEEDESHGKGSESDEDFDTWAWRIVSMTEEEFLKYNAFPAV